MNREQAWQIVCEFTKSESLRKHALAVETCVTAYARKFGEDETKWSITALLHDFDWEIHPEAPDHPMKGEPILAERGVSEEIRRAILSHANYSGVPRESLLEKTLFACDELAGFITAISYVKPSRSVFEVEPASVRKKMKDKAFARSVSRQDILDGAQGLGIDLDEHIAFCVKAMQENAGPLGLQGTTPTPAIQISAWILTLAAAGMLALASPAWAQFGPKQIQFRNSVTALTGTIDIHGTGSGTVPGPVATAKYDTDQIVNGSLKLDQYDPLTGALTGTLIGTIGISETSVLTFACTVTNTLTASTSAQSDFRGQPLRFNLSFDQGSDTWSLWPSNNSVNGTNTSKQECAGVSQSSSATTPMRFMPINMNMGFQFPATGFDLVGTSHVMCSGCGNADSNPVDYTFTYNLHATLKGCNYSLGSSSANLTPGVISGSIGVTAGAGCSWNAQANDPWITIAGVGGLGVIGLDPNGSGPGSVLFSVSPNTTGATRTGSITVAGQSFTVTQAPGGVQFFSVAPCRIADTRNPSSTFGGPTMSGGSARSFPIPQGACNIPAGATAYSINVTAIPHPILGFLTLSPTGQPRPLVSTLNALSGRIVSNAALIPAGSDGGVDVFVTDTADVILDINGYFAPASAPGGLAFYPVTPCRISDTRNAAGAFGGPTLSAGETRSYTISASPCNIPAAAQAFSLNASVVPKAGLGYVTLWPAGQAQPSTSSVTSTDGSIVGTAAIVAAGSGGAISAFVSDSTDLILDINGYYAPPGAGGLLLYPMAPCRIVDTRNAAGSLGGPTMAAGSVRSFPAPASGCGIPAAAKGYSLNVSVVPAHTLGYLSLWPTGAAQPVVSTLNSLAGQILANAALVGSGTDGAVSVFVTDQTDVILDINGLFAP